MRINVRQASGQNFDVEAEAADLVGALKHNIYISMTANGISPLVSIKCLLDGKALSNATTLAEAGVSQAGYVTVRPQLSSLSFPLPPSAHLSLAHRSSSSCQACDLASPCIPLTPPPTHAARILFLPPGRSLPPDRFVWATGWGEDDDEGSALRLAVVAELTTQYDALQHPPRQARFLASSHESLIFYSSERKADWIRALLSESRMRQLKSRFTAILAGMMLPPPPQPSPPPLLPAPIPTAAELQAAASHLSSCFAVGCVECARAVCATRAAHAAAADGAAASTSSAAPEPLQDEAAESARSQVLSSPHLLPLIFTALAASGGDGGYGSSACASLARCALVCRDWAAAAAASNQAWHAAALSDFPHPYAAMWAGRQGSSTAAARAAAVDWRSALRRLMRPLFDPPLPADRFFVVVTVERPDGVSVFEAAMPFTASAGSQGSVSAREKNQLPAFADKLLVSSFPGQCGCCVDLEEVMEDDDFARTLQFVSATLSVVRVRGSSADDASPPPPPEVAHIARGLTVGSGRSDVVGTKGKWSDVQPTRDEGSEEEEEEAERGDDAPAGGRRTKRPMYDVGDATALIFRLEHMLERCSVTNGPHAVWAACHAGSAPLPAAETRFDAAGFLDASLELRVSPLAGSASKELVTLSEARVRFALRVLAPEALKEALPPSMRLTEARAAEVLSSLVFSPLVGPAPACVESFLRAAGVAPETAIGCVLSPTVTGPTIVEGRSSIVMPLSRIAFPHHRWATAMRTTLDAETEGAAAKARTEAVRLRHAHSQYTLVVRVTDAGGATVLSGNSPLFTCGTRDCDLAHCGGENLLEPSARPRCVIGLGAALKARAGSGTGTLTRQDESPLSCHRLRASVQLIRRPAVGAGAAAGAAAPPPEVAQLFLGWLDAPRLELSIWARNIEDSDSSSSDGDGQEGDAAAPRIQEEARLEVVFNADDGQYARQTRSGGGRPFGLLWIGDESVDFTGWSAQQACVQLRVRLAPADGGDLLGMVRAKPRPKGLVWMQAVFWDAEITGCSSPGTMTLEEAADWLRRCDWRPLPPQQVERPPCEATEAEGNSD